MKKFLSLLLVLCAAITSSAQNYDGVNGKFKIGGTWRISGQILYIDAETVPDYKVVSSIGFKSWDYRGQSSVTWSMGLERNMTSAPWGQYRAGIKEIVLTSKVKQIGSKAFWGMTSVKKVTVENSSQNLYVANEAFYNCYNMESFDFSRVKYIGERAFERCFNLQFANCLSLRHVEEGAFDWCLALWDKDGGVYLPETAPTGLNQMVTENLSGYYWVFPEENIQLVDAGAQFKILVDANRLQEYKNTFGDKAGEAYIYAGNSGWYLNNAGNLYLGKGFKEGIPSYTDGQQPWFSIKNKIFAVYINNPAYYWSVGDNAFKGCNNLWDFPLNKITGSIGVSAFEGTDLCGPQTWVVQYLDHVTTIGDRAFAGSNLKKISLGSGLQTIGSKAFQNVQLNEVKIHGAAPTTANDAFSGVPTSSITLPVPDKYYNSYASSTAWSSFNINRIIDFPVYGTGWHLDEDGTLTIIQAMGFTQPSEQPWYSYKDYIEKVVFGNSDYVVTYIGQNCLAFENTGVSKIQSIEAPYVTTINAEAFKNNDILKSFKGENVKTIGNEAFAGCAALEDVDFGDKLTSLGSRVFNGCPAMENFALDAITPPSVNSQTFVGMGASASNAPGRGAKASGSGQQSVTLSVPEEATVNYLAAPYWNLFSMEFIEGHGSIVKSGAYYDGAWVLYSDGTLIASSQTTNGSIDVATVYNDATVTRVEFLGGANEVKSTFFSNLPNLKTVVLNAAVNKVGYRTFQNCAKLESINLENVDTIESEAFKGCSKLASVKLSAIQYINTNAFEGCTSLASVQLAGGCRIRSRAFKGCTSLTSIDLKSATIDGYVFEGCTALSSISNGGLQITTNAFNGCSALKKFDLGSGCWTVYSNAFANTNMQTIYCSRPEPTKLYADAFGSLTLSNITAYVPADYIRMYQKADVWKEMTLMIDTTFESMLPTGGAFGDKGTWQLDDKGTLTLTGTGSMPVLTDDNRYHWNHVFDEWAMFTEDVIISDGWTGINTVIADKNATANKYKNIKTLELGADIKQIRDSSLRYPNLTDVYCYIPDPVNIQTSDKYCPFDKAALIANNATLHVINFTGTKAKYQNSSAWNWFPNIVDDLVTRKEGIIYVTNVHMDKNYNMLGVSASELGTKTYQLTAGVQPANATTPALAWSSSDPTIATVDQNGLVTILSNSNAGAFAEVTITAKATDGSGKKDECRLVIYDADEIIDDTYVESLDADKYTITMSKSQIQYPEISLLVEPYNGRRQFTVDFSNAGTDVVQVFEVRDDYSNCIGYQFMPQGVGTATVTFTANYYDTQAHASAPSVTVTVNVTEDIIFTEESKEGIPVKYIVEDAAKMTCKVYGALEQEISVDPNTGAIIPGAYVYRTAVDPSATGVLTIPTTVRGYAVTGVCDYAFRNCASLTEVNFCAGVERIGEGAFQGCNALTTLRLPYTFKGLGQNMASMLPNLKDVHLMATAIPTSFDWAGLEPGDDALGTGAFDGLREEQQDATLHVAIGCATLYTNAGWDVWFPIIVEDGEEVDNNIASYVCDFTSKVSKHSAYNDAWTYDTEWTVYGGANNNAGWDYVKMGGKSGTLANANPVYVMNKNRMGRNITAIRVTYPSGSFPKNNQMDCSEWGVKVYSDLACTNLLYTVTSSVAITGAEQVVTLKPVPGQPWKAGYGIQVYWNLSNTGSTNGIIWVSKIEYLTDADDAATLWPMYNISFVNWDGFVLQNFPVRENTMPVFEGVTPVHAADAEYTYEFSGWSPEIVAATADAVYTAQYTATPKPVIPDDPDPGTGVDNVQSNEVKCTKILYNGQLYIIRGDMIFNASGMRIK